MAVSYKSGVSINESQRSFAEGLALLLPFDLLVSSGTRSVGSQASAVLNKIQREGTEAVYKLYAQKDLIKEILAAPRNVSAIAAVLAKQVASGRYLSRHLRADALDFSIRGRTAAQIEQMQAAAKKLGAKPVLESDHLHVENVGTGALEQARALATSAGEVAAAAGTAAVGAAVDHKRVLTLALLGGVAAGVLLLWRSRARKRRRSRGVGVLADGPPMAANSRRRRRPHSSRQRRRA